MTTAIDDADRFVAIEDALAKLPQLDELVIGHAAARALELAREGLLARRPSTGCTSASPEPDGTTAR